MYRPLLSIPLIGTLILLIFLMGWFSIHMVKIENAETLRIQHEEYENELSLTLWQLETSALTIYNGCIAELSAENNQKAYTGKEFYINNTITEEQVMPPKSEWSTEQLLKMEFCINCHAPPTITVSSKASKDKTQITQQEPLAPNENLNWSSDQIAISQKRRNQNYTNRANTARKTKETSQKIVDNTYNTLNDSYQIGNAIQGNSVFVEPTPIDATPFQAYWVNDQLYLLRNLETQIHAVTLNHEVIENQLRKEIPNLILDACHHTYVKAENKLLKIIPASDLPFRKNALVTLPYNITVPYPIAPKVNISQFLNLAITWLALIVSILLAGGFILSLIRLSNRRSQFVSSVTHELRTPLTSFQLYSEMLRDELVPSKEKRASYLNTLFLESKRLSHLVENVLSYSQLEQGKISKTELSLKELLPPIIDRLKSRAEQSEARLNIQQIVSLQTHLSTDPTAVEQILFNLIDNACKYGLTDNKKLDLSITETSRHVQFHLRDYGSGIPEDLHRTLFKPFHKSVKAAADAKKPGVGLGLSIARRQAKLLGGDLTLTSSCDQGACFTLSLKK